MPIFGCELLEEGKSASNSREKVKESSDFDRVNARNYRRGLDERVVQVWCVLGDFEGERVIRWWQ